MKKFFVILCAVMVMAVAVSVNAATITSIYGDIDGFGIGVLPDQRFNYGSIKKDPSDPDQTDEWDHGSQSWRQTFDISGFSAITGASIEIMAGGLGYNGIGKLFVDCWFIGTLTDGDVLGNYARIDIFDMSPFINNFMDGMSEIMIETTTSGDGWVLDYSRISITGTSVPVPAAVWLFGSGLIGLIGIRRRTT